MVKQVVFVQRVPLSTTREGGTTYHPSLFVSPDHKVYNTVHWQDAEKYIRAINEHFVASMYFDPDQRMMPIGYLIPLEEDDG